MNKTTGNLSKKMFCKPEVTASFCGILVVILSVFVVAQVSGERKSRFIDLPETTHADFDFYDGVIPLDVYIFLNHQLAQINNLFPVNGEEISIHMNVVNTLLFKLPHLLHQ